MEETTTPNGNPVTAVVPCQECDGWHVATYDHEGQYGEGDIYAVVCGDGLTDYYTTETLVYVPEVGTVVTAKPVGQARRQTFQVTRIDGGYVHGLLLSRKSPGDFRGYVTAYATDVERAAGLR